MQSLFYLESTLINPRLVNHGRGGGFEESEQDAGGIGREIRFEKSGAHQLHPAIAGGSIDCERSVAHAQTGMATSFDVGLRTAKTVDEKAAQTLFGGGEIAAAVHGTENAIVGDLLIKCGDQPRKSFVADGGVYFVFFHDLLCRSRGFVFGTEAETN